MVEMFELVGLGTGGSVSRIMNSSRSGSAVASTTVGSRVGVGFIEP